MKVPSGLGRRGQMWPLSMWVCMSTKAGQTMPRSRSSRGASVSRTGWRDAFDPAVGDDDVGRAEALGIGLAGRVVEEDAGNRGVGDDVARRVGDRGEAGVGHVSSPGARRSRAICGGGDAR